LFTPSSLWRKYYQTLFAATSWLTNASNSAYDKYSSHLAALEKEKGKILIEELLGTPILPLYRLLSTLFRSKWLEPDKHE